MKFTIVLSLIALLPFVAALPAPEADVLKSPEALDAIFQGATSGGTVSALAGSTENEISGPCRAVTVIYARGTGEAGNVGGLTGQNLFTALRLRLGASTVAIQGVNYPANVAGYLIGGDPAGSTTMTNLINEVASRCPSTKIVVGGYSQGAQVTHNAAGRLNAATTSRIVAAFAFGDPFYPRSFGSIPASRTLNICNFGDIICTGLGTAGPHLTYYLDAGRVASFIAARV